MFSIKLGEKACAAESLATRRHRGQSHSLISCGGSFELYAPMFQFDDFSKNEFELPRTRVFPNLRYHHGDFRRFRLHPVNEAEQKGHPDLRKALYPIGFEFSVFHTLRSVRYFPQPLTLDRRRDFVQLCSAPLYLQASWIKLAKNSTALSMKL